jgi:hypothetical protein
MRILLVTLSLAWLGYAFYHSDYQFDFGIEAIVLLLPLTYLGVVVLLRNK